MLRQIKHLQEDMGNFFVRVTVRADIPSSIIAEKVVRVMQRLDLNELAFRAWTKLAWNFDLNLLEKFVVNVHCTTMKYEIIRKPMILERVEVNSLKSAHYY